MRDEALTALRELIEVVEKLRAPGGCPWDREQDHRSLWPHLLEETYEFQEAIDKNDVALLREELGDLLLQVAMHCVIATDTGEGFDIGDVAEEIKAKMISRHPHVFGDVSVRDADEVLTNWEKLKRKEKAKAARVSLLEGIPTGLPALAYAQAVQKRPARLGFEEFPDAASARSVIEVMAEQLQSGADGSSEAAGQLLFAAVALCRHAGVDTEMALRTRVEAFVDRYQKLEAQAGREGADLHGIEREEWERRWRESTPGS